MEGNEEMTSVKKSKLPLYISIGIVLLLVLGYFLIPSVQEFFEEAWSALTSGDKQQTRQWVSQFGFWGPVMIVVVMILQMFLLVIPTPVLMVVSILAYGPFWGVRALR